MLKLPLVPLQPCIFRLPIGPAIPFNDITRIIKPQVVHAVMALVQHGELFLKIREVDDIKDRIT